VAFLRQTRPASHFVWSIRVTVKRIHMATNKSNSGKKTWTLLAAGTAVIVLTAGILLQVTRPPSAFPEETSAAGGRSPQPGKTPAADAAQMATARVARVGKEYITWQELANECVARHGKDILDNLINRKIIQQACDNQGIEVSEAEVSKEIEKNAKKFGLAVDQWMSMLEAERNITTMQYRRDIVWPMLALRKLAGENVKVTKADIKRAFEKNYGERVQAKAIILDNSRRAREVWEKAHTKPDEFEKLAQEFSVDPSSRALGGVIPPIARHSGSEELEKAAFRMKKGEISPVIQIGPELSRYVILKCEGRTVPNVTELTSDIEEILIEELREEKTQLAVATVFDKIKSEARVDNIITGVSTGGERKPAGKTAGGPGAIKQTGGTAARRPAAQSADDDQPAAPVRSATPGKPAARSAAGKPATRPAAGE
jgi:foldase protein PrsA